MEERPLQTPEGTSFSVNNITLEELMKIPSDVELEEYKPLAVSIATRRLSATALDVSYLPPEIKGEWVFNDPITISEYNNMGYVFPPIELIKTRMHFDGTDKAIHGDVVLMVVPMWKWKLLDEAKTRQMEKVHRLSDSKDDQELRKVASDASREGQNEVTADVLFSKTGRLQVSKK